MYNDFFYNVVDPTCMSQKQKTKCIHESITPVPNITHNSSSSDTPRPSITAPCPLHCSVLTDLIVSTTEIWFLCGCMRTLLIESLLAGQPMLFEDAEMSYHGRINIQYEAIQSLYLQMAIL